MGHQNITFQHLSVSRCCSIVEEDIGMVDANALILHRNFLFSRSQKCKCKSVCKEQSEKPHSQHEKSASCNECVQNFRFVG